MTDDRVTTLGTNVDGRVRRLGVAYEVRGLPQVLTSYDSATVGGGNVLNQVRQRYNVYGQIVHSDQQTDGPVTSSSPTVGFNYADGSSNSIRTTGISYPNGRTLGYDFGTANSAADKLSRVAAITEGTTRLAEYGYLGTQSFVTVDDPEPGLQFTQVDQTNANDPDTGDIYSGLDRFGRVKDCRWIESGSSTDVVRLKYGHDRANSRIWRQDVVATALGTNFDERYAYDGLRRLKTMDRGRLTFAGGIPTGFTSTQYSQCWTLDATGNWAGFREDANGDGEWDLVQSRTANGVNEITGITNSHGATWANPAYDPAGNMTSLPQPKQPAQSYAATYDAWNRLVKLVDSSTGQTVQEHQYDARTFRVLRKDYTSGSLTETRRFYYTPGWRCVEERVGTSTSAERQHVWGLRYIDELVLRDRDTDGNGTLDERLYACQDANWNVVGLTNAAGAVQERYDYDPYGTVRVLTPTFGTRTNSNHAWETTYAGYRYDAGTGLYNVRFRVLSPIVGWGQRDPLGNIDGADLTEYLGGRPLAQIDPLGLQAVSFGTYEFSINPTEVNGMPGGHVDIRFRPSPDQPCPCSSFDFIQVARTSIGGEYFNPDYGLGGDFYGVWEPTHVNGYYVDLGRYGSRSLRPPHYGSPFWNDMVDVGVQQPLGSCRRPAHMIDTPALNPLHVPLGTLGRMQFETCVYCRPASPTTTRPGRQLGCVRWGLTRSADGTVTFDSPTYTESSSQSYNSAYQQYMWYQYESNSLERFLGDDGPRTPPCPRQAVNDVPGFDYPRFFHGHPGGARP